MRYIDVNVRDEYLDCQDRFIGAEGSLGDVAFRLTFSSMWDGLTKTVHFQNYGGSTATATVDSNNNCVIPAEAKQYAGKCLVYIEGAVETSGGFVSRKTCTNGVEFTVAANTVTYR